MIKAGRVHSMAQTESSFLSRKTSARRACSARLCRPLVLLDELRCEKTARDQRALAVVGPARFLDFLLKVIEPFDSAKNERWQSEQERN